jgi:2',3'-cyclic-nucleotide 2'-phosphodiesterase (5'-nucleotidase family)
MTAAIKVTCLIIISWIVVGLSACSKPEAPQEQTLTVAYSNDLMGEIRSCGCKTNDFGGLGRQASLVSLLADTSRNFLLLEGGDFFGSEVNYGKEKAEVTMKAMAIMGYDGVVIGETDLGFGIDYLRQRSKDIGLPILVANLFDAQADTLIFPASRLVTTKGGLRIGLIGVMSPSLKLPPQIPQGTLRITDPARAILSAIEDMGADVDLVVILAHMQRKDARLLARKVERADLIVHGHEGRPMRKMKRVGNAFLLQVLKQGRYLGHAFCTLNSAKRIETISTGMNALDTGYPDDERVAKLFAAYDMHIRAKEKSGEPIGLVTAGQEGITKPFVGAEKCKECHDTIYASWLETPHAYAFDTLERNSREFDRDCTPCHTTGFYKLGGFSGLAATPELINVQCESCHGNGYDHAQNAEVLPKVNAAAGCTSCHTEEWTPDFSYSDSWQKIRH